MENKVGIKTSKQRDAILSVLQGTTSHPSADWIYENVKLDFPKISLGTVYRNLSLLTDLNVIMKLDVGDGVDRYDANYTPHYHLFCNNCGRLIDLNLPYNSTLDKDAEKTDSVKINYHSLIFNGLCQECI